MPVRSRSRGGGAAGKGVPTHGKGNRRPGLNRIGTEAARIPAMSGRSDFRSVCIVSCALVALFLKLAIAYNTVGTNDAINFYGFARALSDHSLEWTYQHSRYFNHPPLVAYYLRAIFDITEQSWCQALGVHFPFLLRLPGIVADFILVLILLRAAKTITQWQIPYWALMLFALSPVSLMVAGFHGNTDPVMVLFMVWAGLMCLHEKPLWCGVLFALACQVKIAPLLLLPAMIFFWLSRRRLAAFGGSFALVMTILWAEPLCEFPLLFAKNVLCYGSYWGIWGVTYCLRLTGLPHFDKVSFLDLEPPQVFVSSVLKIIIIGAALLIAWRRRNLRGWEIINTLAYTWILFFVFAPGVCAQYLIWLAPFVLVLSPVLYTNLLVASSIFLFTFYNSTAGGLPWSVAISTDGRRELWAPWSLLPWVVLIVGAIAFWRRNAQTRPAFRLLSLEALPAEGA
jgi:uncharacterized membrane protein